MHIDRTPEELTRYVRRLEELAFTMVAGSEQYEELIERLEMDRLTYVEALERLILDKAGRAD